tara:strand:+ start:302 stop:1426 length:1125 start_codon:yes stop_codon:yes gene_type:complete
MKKNILIIFTTFILFACNNSNNKYILSATTDHDENKRVFLIKVGKDNRPIAVDSTEVLDGKFSFSDSIVIPEMHYVYFENDRENIPVVLEPGSIEVKVYKDSVRSSKITGTKSNEDFDKYLKETNDFYVELNKIQLEIRNASIRQDTLVAKDLNDQFDLMRSRLTNYEISFMSKNNDSYISTLILQRMIIQNEIEIENAIGIFEKFTELIKKTPSSLQIKESIDQYNKQKEETPKIGSIAPNFTGPGLNDEIISFSDIDSKVIMIDFWASWCAPCRVENPFYVYLNTKFKTSEFQIVGVSLDRDKESWKNAIKTDGLVDWIHISHTMFWNEPIARLYNITQMPTAFILDSNKKIIAMDVKGDDLENLIIEQLSL